MNESTIETPVATGGKDKGFTLIELLIVIVILGVLATVTVFAVRGVTDKGKDSACSADKNTLETAIESYFAQAGVSAIPATDNAATSPAVEGDDPTTAAVETSAEAELVRVGFLRSQSSKYDVATDGKLTGISPCT